VVIVDMHADNASGGYTETSDLMCGACHHIIAMLYLAEPQREAT